MNDGTFTALTAAAGYVIAAVGAYELAPPASLVVVGSCMFFIAMARRFQ